MRRLLGDTRGTKIEVNYKKSNDNNKKRAAGKQAPSSATTKAATFSSHLAVASGGNLG